MGEPDFCPRARAIGTARHIGAFIGVPGLSFFVNYPFVRPTDGDSRRHLK
jgi:hypothetical protein